jgi:hypothetical protein
MGVESTWTVAEGENGFLARCTMGDAEYVMALENEVMSMPVYAAPTTTGGSAVPVARRLTVRRTTGAPQACFGQDEMSVGVASPYIKGEGKTMQKKTPRKATPEGKTPATEEKPEKSTEGKKTKRKKDQVEKKVEKKEKKKKEKE